MRITKADGSLLTKYFHLAGVAVYSRNYPGRAVLERLLDNRVNFSPVKLKNKITWDPNQDVTLFLQLLCMKDTQNLNPFTERRQDSKWTKTIISINNQACCS